jgi:hypothetical protein
MALEERNVFRTLATLHLTGNYLPQLEVALRQHKTDLDISQQIFGLGPQLLARVDAHEVRPTHYVLVHL